MIDLKKWRKAWALLDPLERRNARITIGFVILGALSSALMVGSIVPFLTVLSDPGKIGEMPALAAIYTFFGFTNEYTFMVALGGASFAVILITSIIQMAKIYVVERFAMMRVHSISHRLLVAYLRQPYSFFLNRHTGDMGTRVLAESQQLVFHFLRPAAELIAATLTVCAIVGLLLWIDPVTAIISLTVLGGVYSAVFLLNRRVLNEYGVVRADANSERYRIANEALSGIKDIKLLGREANYADLYANLSKRMARAIVNVQVLSQVPQLSLQAVALGGVILLCIALMDAEGLSSGKALGDILPVLGVFAFAGQRLMPELGKLYQSLAYLQAGGASVDLIYEDLILKAGGSNMPKLASGVLRLKHNLELQRVSYLYPNSSSPSLHEVSFTVQAGERIGIVGSTGAGKTTLADIVLGLLQPSEGRILVDGIELNYDNLRDWQRSVGYVPQDIFLTDASVYENIALGLSPEEIDTARVHNAAEIAQIDAFIRAKLPVGYDTTIGERGVRLSGGQRQRLGIARAMYYDADLIVFDEATSALDNLTERDVMESIDALPGDKTVLIIAHRLSTVMRCDRIIVMHQGRLVGFDTWDALMADNTLFQSIAKMNVTA